MKDGNLIFGGGGEGGGGGGGVGDGGGDGSGSGGVRMCVCAHAHVHAQVSLLNNRSIKAFNAQSKQSIWQLAYATMCSNMMLRI